ncbi:MAG: hypothetical protein K5650_08130 [Bacteroidales bacterium]|nr:hypothetical protein [Bacteroidales bacterium]
MTHERRRQQGKDQFVIAHVTGMDYAEALADTAAAFAAALGKSMMLLYVADPSLDTLGADEAEQRLAATGRSYVALKGDTREVVASLPEMFGTVLMVTAVDPMAPRRNAANPRTLLRGYLRCRTAYLVLTAPQEPLRAPQRVALSVDYRRESKEKMLWASYMARFMGSTVEVCHRDYRDEGLRQKWHNNMLFIKKLFSQLGLKFEQRIVTGRSTRVDIDVLTQLTPNLLISRTTDIRERDIVDIFAGTQEQHLLLHPSRTPLLFLNPRDDLYVLCD